MERATFLVQCLNAVQCGPAVFGYLLEWAIFRFLPPKARRR